MTDNAPMSDIAVRTVSYKTRFWDHNWNEVFPPDDFRFLTVDSDDGRRWSGMVTHRVRLTDD